MSVLCSRVSRFCRYYLESLPQMLTRSLDIEKLGQPQKRRTCDERSRTVSSILSMGDPLKSPRTRTVGEGGAKGAFVAPYTIPNKSHAHPDYDCFWAVAQEFDVPVGIHPCSEPSAKRVYQRFKDT